MKAKSKRFPADRTEPERRKDLSEEQIQELEIAGGVEGGMQAGSAGGPGERTAAVQPGKESSARAAQKQRR